MTKPGCVLPKQWQPYMEQLEAKVRELEADNARLTTKAENFRLCWNKACEETEAAEAKVRELETKLAAAESKILEWQQMTESAQQQSERFIEERNAAEATLARVEALPDKWREGVAFRNCPSMVNHPSWDECADELQAALKGET